MSEPTREQAIKSALLKAVRGTPLALFQHLRPAGDTTAERFNAQLQDGTNVVFERRTTAVQVTEAFHAQAGANQPLKDGEYRLKDGGVFRVAGGRIDFDAVMADPDGTEPFRQYGAWKEIVAIENPLLSLPDPLTITDVVRFVAPDGNSYYAVQQGVDRPYQAYMVVNHALRPLADGAYPLPGGRSFQVKAGDVTSASLGDLKVHAFDSTRLPL